MRGLDKTVSFKPSVDTIIASAVISLMFGAALPSMFVSRIWSGSPESVQADFSDLITFFEKEIFQDTSSYITVSLGVVAIGATLYISAVNRNRTIRRREFRDNELMVFFTRYFNLASALVFAFSSLGSVLMFTASAHYSGPRVTLLFASLVCWVMNCCFAGLCSPGEITSAKNLSKLQSQYRKSTQMKRKLNEKYSGTITGPAKNHTFCLTALSTSFHLMGIGLFIVIFMLLGDIGSMPIVLLYGAIVATMCYFLYYYTLTSVYIAFRGRIAYIAAIVFTCGVVPVLYVMTQVGLTLKGSGVFGASYAGFDSKLWILILIVWIVLSSGPVIIIQFNRKLKFLVAKSRVFYSNSEMQGNAQAIARLRAEEEVVHGRARWRGRRSYEY